MRHRYPRTVTGTHDAPPRPSALPPAQDAARHDGGELLELLHTMLHGLRREAGDHLDAPGTTPGQLRLLRILARCDEPQRPSALAAALDVAPRSVTTKVDAAEDDGYVRRLPDPTDRRATLVALTDAGRDVLRRVAEERHLGAEQRLARLDPDDRAALLRLLRVVAPSDTPAPAGDPGCPAAGHDGGHGARTVRVGLTGGIAAGKSAAARRFAERGAVVVDHDALAREVVEPGSEGLAAVVEAFGTDVLRPDGALDRPVLGRLVFGDDAARARLEAIVHPRVRALSHEREEQARAAGTPVVVHDVPLLVETGQADAFDLVVVVDAPVDVRVRRLVEGRGMSEPDARARIAAQADDDDRREAADVVLDGSGDVQHLAAEVDLLWQRLQDDVTTTQERR